MYFAQVFETGLINVLTVLETTARKPKSRREYIATFDALYEMHEDLTFGNLLKALTSHNFLTGDLMQEAKLLKAERDHLAHRFYRDHPLDQLAVGGCLSMIEVLEEARVRFMNLDLHVTALLDKAYEGQGIDPTWIKRETKRLMEEMREEAVAQRCSKIKSS